jgi:hypothetical protein
VTPQIVPPADPAAIPVISSPSDPGAAAAATAPAKGDCAARPPAPATPSPLPPADPAAPSPPPAGPAAPGGPATSIPAAPPSTEIAPPPPLLEITEFGSVPVANTPSQYTLVGDVLDTASPLATVTVNIQGDGLSNGQTTVAVNGTDGSFQVTVELPTTNNVLTASHVYTAVAQDATGLTSAPVSYRLDQGTSG